MPGILTKLGERIKKTMMKNSSIEINGKTLNIETGRIAKQASGSVVVTFGETVVNGDPFSVP